MCRVTSYRCFKNLGNNFQINGTLEHFGVIFAERERERERVISKI
jgi:hypothetical protein